MRLNNERYKLLWQKYISMGATWPGTLLNIHGNNNHHKGRFYIKFPNGVKMKTVHMENNTIVNGSQHPIHKVVPTLKLFYFWEHNNFHICERTDEQLTIPMHGYIHVNTEVLATTWSSDKFLLLFLRVSAESLHCNHLHSKGCVLRLSSIFCFQS